MMLVTVEQVQTRLRLETLEGDDPAKAAEEADLEMMIEAASASVVNYLKSYGSADFIGTDGEPDIDSAGDPVGVPGPVRQAVFYLVGLFYRDRDGTEMANWEPGYLPKPVVAILYPLRKPALA